jgi:hypothetical protein
MPLIDVDDVQPWLEYTKLGLDHGYDLSEEPFISEFVRSRLSSCGIASTTWTTPDTTPVLVRGIVGMLVAAQIYNKHYSETDEGAGNPYANKLEERAEMLMVGICAGTLDISEIVDDPFTTGSGGPSFYPTDAVGVLEPEEAIRFTMGKVF